MSYSNNYGGAGSGNYWGGFGQQNPPQPQIETKNNMPVKLDSQYTYQRELGEGACGYVYLYKDLISGEEIAIKVEVPRQSKMSGGTLTREGYFMKVLNNSPKVPVYDKNGNPCQPELLQPGDQGQKRLPKYFSDTFAGQHQCLKIEYIKYSITEYLNKLNQGRDIYDPIYRQNCIGVMRQMLQAVQDIHSGTFVHQDIKLDNFRVTESGFVKLIDFGISMSFVNDNKKDVEEHKQIGRYGFQGTPLYGSISSLDGYTQSRRDDVEALAYVFMCMLDEPKVTWRNQQDQKEIMRQKREFLNLPQDSDKISIFHRQLHKFIIYCSSLQYEARPDYDVLHSMINNVYKDFETFILQTVEYTLNSLVQSYSKEIYKEICPYVVSQVLNKWAKEAEELAAQRKREAELKKQKERELKRQQELSRPQIDKQSSTFKQVQNFFGLGRSTSKNDEHGEQDQQERMSDEDPDQNSRYNNVNASKGNFSLNQVQLPNSQYRQVINQATGKYQLVQVGGAGQLTESYSVKNYPQPQDILQNNGRDIALGNPKNSHYQNDQQMKEYSGDLFETDKAEQILKPQSKILQSSLREKWAQTQEDLLTQISETMSIIDQQHIENQKNFEIYMFNWQSFDTLISILPLSSDEKRYLQRLSKEEKNWKLFHDKVIQVSQQLPEQISQTSIDNNRSLAHQIRKFKTSLKVNEVEHQLLNQKIRDVAESKLKLDQQVTVEIDPTRLDYALNQQIPKMVADSMKGKYYPKQLQYQNLYIAFDVDNFSTRYKMQYVKSQLPKYSISQKIDGPGKYPGQPNKSFYKVWMRGTVADRPFELPCFTTVDHSLDVFGVATLQQ